MNSKLKFDSNQFKTSIKTSFRKIGPSLQNLGKALLFPIAVLPFAALLNRFGILAMDLNKVAVGADPNFGWWIGFILQKPGVIVFDNIALLFAIGVAFGFSKDYRGEAGLIGAVFYLALMALLSEGGLPNLFYKHVQEITSYKQNDIGEWIANPNSGLSELFYVPIYAIDGGTQYITGGKYILNTGVLGGIVSGSLTAFLYNRYKEIKLPEALSFFGGRRFIPMLALVVVIPTSFLFAIIWPWIQYGLVKFGGLISSSDAWAIPGAGLYAVINRFMQPFGAHHILNTFLWFQLPIEGNVITSISGNVVLGEDIINLAHGFTLDANGAIIGMDSQAITFLSGITKDWATTVDWDLTANDFDKNIGLFNQYFSYRHDLIASSDKTIIGKGDGNYIVMGDINAFQKSVVSGTFQTGFFPLYWGGLTGASAAMIMAAKKEKRKELFTFFVGIGVVSILTGIDEPIFFTFTFVAPILWVFNAIFTGIFAAIIIAMHIHVGFGFSGGLIDYIISFANGWGMSNWEGVVNGGVYGVLSNPLWLLALAVVMFPVYYFSFFYTIKKLDLKTPGREDETPTSIESGVQLVEVTSKDKYDIIAENLIKIIGKNNISNLANCATRLRMVVKYNKVGTNAEFMKAGAKGSLKVGDTGLQIVIGTDVEHVANAMNKLLKK